MISKLFGAALLVGSLSVVYLFEGSSFTTGALRVFHWPAMLLTSMGPLALMLLASDMATVFGTFWLALTASPTRARKRSDKDGQYLRTLSEKFYEDGHGAFEENEDDKVSSSVRKLVERLSLRMPFADVRELLGSERDRRRSELDHSIALLGLAVRLSPSVGMLGTILGMVQLLSAIQDPAQLGPHMSLALFTTFYGLFFSLAVWTPFLHKVERVLEVEMQAFDRAEHWLEVTERRKSSEYFAQMAALPGKKAEAAETDEDWERAA